MVNVIKVVGAGKGYTTVLADDGNTYRLQGARNWRNNNPGNIEYGPYAKSLGAVGSDGRFAVFPTLEQGSAAQENLQFNSKGYQGLTVGQAINRYAPPFENNTNAYANAVARAAGVSTDTPMSALTPEQRAAFMAAQREVEGFRAGKQIPVGMTTPVPFAQLANGAPMALPANGNATPSPPLPIPRPATPGMKPLPAPAPLTAPSRSPWDIPGVINVSREMALKPDSSGFYPTMASGYINRALNAEKQKIAPAVQQATQTVGNAATSARTAASQAIDQGKAALGNAGSQAMTLLGGLFGGQPSPPPRPPLDIPPKPLQTVGMEPPPITMGIPQPAMSPVKFTMSDLMGTSMARVPLPAPAPLAAPSALPPLTHRNVPSAPNWQPTIAPPVSLVQLASGRMAPVNAQTPHGGTVQPNGSIQFKNWSTPGPSQPQKWWQINSAGGTV